MLSPDQDKLVDDQEEFVIIEATDAIEETANIDVSPEVTSWLSLQGALVHSTSWLYGTSEDIILSNPCYDSSSDITYSIFFVHGTADRSYAFGMTAKRLLETNPDGTNLLPTSIDKIYMLAFEGRYQGNSIEFFAEQVKYKLIRYGIKNVILSGHSRGGAVVAYVEQFLLKNTGIICHGVLPLCSPLHGSPLALFPLNLLSTSVAQMMPGSGFLSTLRDSIASSSSKTRYYYFGAEDDSIVPHANTYIEGGSSVIILPRHGHLSILTTPELPEYMGDCLAQIIRSPLPIPPLCPLQCAYLEVEAEVFALKYRTHVYSSAKKIAILQGLKCHLQDMAEGHPSPFPDAKTIGEFIQYYLSLLDAELHISYREVLMHQLNPTFFQSAVVPKSLYFLDQLMESYRDVLLPIRIEPTTDFSTIRPG